MNTQKTIDEIRQLLKDQNEFSHQVKKAEALLDQLSNKKITLKVYELLYGK